MRPQARPGTARRRSAALPLAALALAAVACSGLQPLPRSSGAGCRPPGGSAGDAAAAAFWDCLRAGNAIPPRQESAFRSTLRVVDGDLERKRRDQQPATACTTALPDPRFRLVEETFPEGTAPLHAFFHPGAPGQPLVVLVHGLYDSKASRYVALTARALADEGFGVLVPDMRWHGCLLTADSRWLPTLGPAEARDLVAWSRWLHEREGGRPVGLLGYSLGALDVIHALAEPEAPDLFELGGVAVSPPGEMGRALDRLERPSYMRDEGGNVLFLRSFRSFLEKRVAQAGLRLPTAGEGCRPAGGAQAGAPAGEPGLFLRMLCYVGGHVPGRPPEDGATLLARSEPAPLLARVRQPLLILATRNDPIFTEAAAVALADGARGNPHVLVWESDFGGHIGQPGLYPTWTVETFARFFRAAPAPPR